MAKDLAIVLNSGSVNSAVVTALAAQKYRPIMVHVEETVDPAARTRAAYDQQVAHYKPYREHTLPLPFLGSLPASGESNLLAADPRQGGMLPPRLVRLLPLLAVTVPFAVHYQAAAIYVGLRIGSNAEDLARATEYIQVFNELLQLPCNQVDLEIHAPLLELDPWQVVDLAFQVNAPLDRAWSCTSEGTEPCGTCPGCRQREAAFAQAGKPDPLRITRAR